MNELSKEVREIINFELDQAEEARTHKYCKNLRIIGVMPIFIGACMRS